MKGSVGFWEAKAMDSSLHGDSVDSRFMFRDENGLENIFRFRFCIITKNEVDSE